MGFDIPALCRKMRRQVYVGNGDGGGCETFQEVVAVRFFPEFVPDIYGI